MPYGGNAEFWGMGRNVRNRGNFGQGARGENIPAFLSTLSPGIRVELQFNDLLPAQGTFQGFENGNIILTNYNGFPGLVRISADRVNAVAPFSYGGSFGGYGGYF